MSAFTFKKIATTTALGLSLLSAVALAREFSSQQYAEMEVSYASGFYNEARNGTLSLDTRDGEAQPSSMTFTVEGRKLQARLTKIRMGRCGDLYQARLNVPNDRLVTDLELIDYSQARCRLFVRHKWHASIKSREPDGSISMIEMEGDPQN